MVSVDVHTDIRFFFMMNYRNEMWNILRNCRALANRVSCIIRDKTLITRLARWIFSYRFLWLFNLLSDLGNDKSCDTLEKVSEEAGMVVKYQKSSQHPTGKCAVLITGQDRSLVTKLDAANHFTPAHFEDKANWALVESAKIYYSSGKAVGELSTFSMVL